MSYHAPLCSEGYGIRDGAIRINLLHLRPIWGIVITR
jgi:hypothetical protein